MANKTTPTKPVEQMNIYEKLAAVRKYADAIQKNKRGFNYNYVGEDDVLKPIQVGMDKYNLTLLIDLDWDTFSIETIATVKTKKDKAGNPYDETTYEYRVTSKAIYTWVNNDNPEERIVSTWAIVGQMDKPPQSYGSALTYANRYYMLKFFQIATPNDDPDIYRAEKQDVASRDDRELAASIVSEVHATVTSWLDGLDDKVKADKRKELLALVKSIARDADGKATTNYNEIVKSDIASDLMEKVNEFIGGKK